MDTEGVRSSVHAIPRHESDCWDWVSAMWAEHGTDLQLVFPRSVIRAAILPRVAVDRDVAVWSAPDMLVQGLKQASHLNGAELAATLARLPDCSVWRGLLTRATSITHPRQLPLF